MRRRAAAADLRRIAWRPERLSSSFHGRDLFAPVAAQIAASGAAPAGWLEAMDPDSVAGAAWPDDLAEVVHIDHFGNLMSGLRAAGVAPDATLRVAGQAVRPARIFGDAPAGAPFWYGNSCGLVEIAAPGASAAEMLGVRRGAAIAIDRPG
jgi:S-adenosylmethionine hydrolase